MTDTPPDRPARTTERLTDLGVARMLAVLAALHVVTGGAAAAVLGTRAGVVVALADGVAALALLGAAALALRLGPAARVAAHATAGRRLDLALVVTGLALAGIAGALRVVATGAVWTALEVPLAVLVAAALPRRAATAAGVAAIAPAVAAAAIVVASGARTASLSIAAVVGAVLPLAAAPAAAGIALAWRRRVALLTERLLVAREAAGADAVRDQLTGVVNRRGLDMVAAPMVENARRQGEAAHALFVDVDGFREANERLGTAAGDDVLRAVAAALATTIRTTDVVARWGGDEFVVVGPGTGTSPLELERRVHAQLAATPPVPGEAVVARVSIGSATLVPWDEGNLDALLRRAEQDMRLRRSLRRQRADRGEVPAPPRRPVAGSTEH